MEAGRRLDFSAGVSRLLRSVLTITDEPLVLHAGWRGRTPE